MSKKRNNPNKRPMAPPTDLNRPIYRNRIPGDLLNAPQPTGNADPRTLGGDMAGPGGPHAKDAVVIDTTDVVLLERCDVSIIGAVRKGEMEPVTYLQLGGRVNKTTRQVQVGFMAPTDGVAALISELLAVADRADQMLIDLCRRLVTLQKEGNLDLTRLRAAIEAAQALTEETE